MISWVGTEPMLRNALKTGMADHPRENRALLCGSSWAVYPGIERGTRMVTDFGSMSSEHNLGSTRASHGSRCESCESCVRAMSEISGAKSEISGKRMRQGGVGSGSGSAGLNRRPGLCRSGGRIPAPLRAPLRVCQSLGSEPCRIPRHPGLGSLTRIRVAANHSDPSRVDTQSGAARA